MPFAMPYRIIVDRPDNDSSIVLASAFTLAYARWLLDHFAEALGTQQLLIVDHSGQPLDHNNLSPPHLLSLCEVPF